MRTVRNLLTLATIASIASLAACAGDEVKPLEQSPEADPNEEIYAKKILLADDGAKLVPDRYIVVFHDDHMPLRSQMAEVSQLAGDVLSARGFDSSRIERTFNTALSGFAVRMNEDEMRQLVVDPAIRYVEQDQYVSLNVTWGLDRTDQRNLPLDNVYDPAGDYEGNGSGVHAYVIDTGIRASHNEFSGRVGNGHDAVDGDSDPSDCNGHGTHVAGTVGGTTYGMAPGVTLHGVRVLDCNGSGSYAGVIAGIDWVTANHQSPAVANMSLGGGFSQAVNDAVTNSVNAGVVFAVAAGNESTDACTRSPASTPAAITVGSSTSSDSASSFSNSGSCVDLYAPGSSITSAWHTGDSATNTISGTSMASPHVCGAAALRLGNPGAGDVHDEIVAHATPGVLSGANPNRLLYVGDDAAPDPETNCTDGVDNDGDGATDCADSDCSSDPACQGGGGCPGGYTEYAGTISSGQSHASAGAASSGSMHGILSGSAPDIDLYLEQYTSSWWSSGWSAVASSESASSSEEINTSVGSGEYRWRVYGYSGSGITYTLCVNQAL